MDAQLLQYLEQYKLNGESMAPGMTAGYTHTSQMLPHTGKYRLQHSDMEDFWKFYCEYLWTKGDDFKSGLSEKPNEYMPILADIDLTFAYEEGQVYEDHFYTQQHLMTVVKTYIDVIKYCIEDLNPDHLVCFVLEKKKPYVSGVRVKNGFHLHFPFVFMAHHEQDIQIIPRIIKHLDEVQLFRDIGIASSGQVIDKSCTKKHWLLYGSRKDAKLEAYRLTNIIDITGNPITLEQAISRVQLINQNDEPLEFIHPNELDLEPADADLDGLEYYLPRILSVHPYGKNIYKCKTTVTSILKDKLTKAKDYKGTFEAMPMTNIIDMCKKLMPMIAVSRADNRETWIEMGWILYNITQGCQEGLALWIDFSRKTSRGNFSETECEWQWNKMELRGYTLGSLRHYASIDSGETYKLFTHEESLKRINDSLQGGHVDLAKQLHDVLGTKFVCAKIKENIWFEFKNNRWFMVERGISLRARINSELLPKYSDEISKSYVGRDANPQDEATQARIKKLNHIVTSLKSAGFKDSIMKECVEQFYNGDFMDKLDNNKYLLGFNNGVLDLKTCEFRAGKPDDFVSMTTGYDYREFCDEDPEVQEVEMILHKLFPDPFLRKYFLEYCARLLKGGNDAKTFLCFTGVGDNGKSVAMELLEKALGRYMVKLPTSLVTGKRTQSAAANPEIARLHGVRFAVLQEPDGSDTINGGVLKELTGNDSMYARGLFQAGKDIVQTFKLALICNKLPRLTAEDQAIWNRTRVCPFESRFPKNNAEVPATWEEQVRKKVFYRDATIAERFEDLKYAFMWIMFRTYKECKQIGWMPEPKKVMEATNEYRKNNDIMLQFVAECIKQDHKVGVSITLNEVFEMFRPWFTSTFHGVKMPSKNDLRDDLLRRWGPMNGNRWMNYRLSNSQDHVQEGRARVLNQDDLTDATGTDDDSFEDETNDLD